MIKHLSVFNWLINPTGHQTPSITISPRLLPQLYCAAA
jgi:hypothetical protein